MAAALVLVRHGESTWNAAHRLQGQADPPLSERGRDQALRLAPLIERLAPARAVCSDLRRARETARLLGFGDADPDARWRELHMGDWQGRLQAEVEATDDAAFTAWATGGRGAPGGETFEQMNERVGEAAEALLADPDGRTTLVVCHGGPIRSVCTAVLGIPRARLTALGNCSVTIVRAGSSGPRLAGYNCGPEGPVAPQAGI